VSHTYPRVVPANLSAEVHTASDALQLAYRKLHQNMWRWVGSRALHEQIRQLERISSATFRCVDELNLSLVVTFTDLKCRS